MCFDKSAWCQTRSKLKSKYCSSWRSGPRHHYSSCIEPPSRYHHRAPIHESENHKSRQSPHADPMQIPTWGCADARRLDTSMDQACIQVATMGSCAKLGRCHGPGHGKHLVSYFCFVCWAVPAETASCQILAASHLAARDAATFSSAFDGA